MGWSHLIAARVSPETKVKFRTLAEQQQITESALLKQLIELTVQRVNQGDSNVLRSPARRLRAARLYVRLHPDDQLLLTERAAARQMPAATYVSRPPTVSGSVAQSGVDGADGAARCCAINGSVRRRISALHVHAPINISTRSPKPTPDPLDSFHTEGVFARMLGSWPWLRWYQGRVWG